MEGAWMLRNCLTKVRLLLMLHARSSDSFTIGRLAFPVSFRLKAAFKKLFHKRDSAFRRENEISLHVVDSKLLGTHLAIFFLRLGS